MNFLRKHVWLFYFVLALIVFGWFKPNAIILGGDFGWPQSFLTFFNITRYIWDSSVNFGYSASRQLASFYPYATWGLILESLHLSRTSVQQIIFYFSFAISGLGFFLFSRKLGLNAVGSFFAGLVYMYSPFALSVGWSPVYGVSFPFYSFLPLNLFFFTCLLDKNNSTGKKILSLVLLFLLYFGVSYSNPAYFLLFFVCTLSIAAYLFTINHNYRIARWFLVFWVLYVLLNSFWIIPVGLNLKSEFAGADNAAAGLIDDRQTMQLNSVTVLDALRLQGLWTTTVTQVAGDYYYDWHRNLRSPPHIIFSFIFPFFIALAAIFSRKDREKRGVVIFMLLLFVFGILLNSGFKTKGWPEYVNTIIFSDYLQRMFRTVYTKLGILMVLPAVFLFGYSVQSIHSAISNKVGKMNFFLILLVSFLYFEGSPFFNGQIIKSQGNLLPSYNVRIPREYFDLRTYDEYLKLDGRYVTLPFARSYNYIFKWADGGYNGGDFLRTILNNKSIIYQYNASTFINGINRSIYDKKNDVVLRLLALAGVKYIFNHSDLDLRVTYNPISATESFKRELFYSDNLNKLISNRYFTIGSLKNPDYLPHLYIPQILISTSQNIGIMPMIVSDDTYNIRSALYFNNTSKINSDNNEVIKFNPKELKKETIINTPISEYKMINPIKYRTVVRGAKGKFPLVFSEGFNEGWKAYLVRPSIDKLRISNKILSNYKILDGNSNDQASSEEVKSFIDKGWISTLGDGKVKEIRHQKWGDNRQEFDYSEKYNIDFISKNFQGTIQNDNLPSGQFYETWFEKPIEDNKNHSMVNGYANSWIIDTNKLCHPDLAGPELNRRGEGSDKTKCVKNTDGSYDFEVVVEFLPQRFFYLGLFITGTTLVTCLSYLIWALLRRKVPVLDKINKM